MQGTIIRLHLLVDQPLTLINIAPDQVKIGVFVQHIFLEIVTLLHISQNERRYLFKSEVRIRRIAKDLVGILLMDNNEDICVASLLDLLCLTEEASLLDVECFVLDRWLFAVGHVVPGLVYSYFSSIK